MADEETLRRRAKLRRRHGGGPKSPTSAPPGHLLPVEGRGEGKMGGEGRRSPATCHLLSAIRYKELAKERSWRDVRTPSSPPISAAPLPISCSRSPASGRAARS